jgi:hypothetical protein
MNKAITRTFFIAGYLPAKDNFRAIERKEVPGGSKTFSHVQNFSIQFENEAI